ncbi:hypothetical protein NBRC116590_00610 [Pelagimonas sp. KU-00592-HH]|uniref:hypothetical protein n=1 Tax=Pelagimonas sp. KU-00592-HH TaxID=3127651 RepID=UPI00310558F3
MRYLVLLAMLVPGPALADYNLNGKTIDCYCTDTSGNRVELGEMICLHVDGRMFMAQCQMSLNVPMWREISPACLSSDAGPSIGGQSRNPAIDALRIDTKITPPKT